MITMTQLKQVIASEDFGCCYEYHKVVSSLEIKFEKLVKEKNFLERLANSGVKDPKVKQRLSEIEEELANSEKTIINTIVDAIFPEFKHL